MTVARQGAAAVVTADGRILVTGGQDASGPLSSAEFVSGASAGSMLTPRYAHIAVALNDGRVLVAGGRTTGDAVTNAAEMFTSGSWTPISSMLVARAGATATLLSDGRVLIAGGEGSGGPLQTTEIFDPASGQFSNGAPMTAARKNHAATLLNDKRVLIAGGSDGNNPLASTDVYDPATNAVSAGPAMASAREGLSATTLLKGTVLLAGGGSASTEILDLASHTSTSGPSMSATRSGQLALLLPNNNTVLMAGGSSSSAAADVYVPWANAFAPFGTLSSARTGVAGGTSPQTNSAAVAGGADANGVSAAVDVVRFPTVKTDKPDYHPGETAIISGSGFAPNETVKVVIEEVVDIDNDSPITLSPAPVADGGGNFTVTFPIDEADLSVRFYLSATGQTSGLTAGMTFTDARNLNLTFAGTGAGTVKLTPNTGTVLAPVSCGGTGAAAASQTVSSTCASNISFTDNGATVTFLATANGGSTFAGWSAALNLSPSTCAGTTNPCSAVFTGNPQLTVTFNTVANVAITVDTSPTGRSISVDGGGTLTAPQTFNWVPGSNHTIATTTPQSGGTGKQFVFTGWSDTGAISHSITVPASATTYTASFKTQWQLTLAITAGVPTGLSNITGGTTGTFYDDGTVVSLSAATPVADGAGKRWAFKNWTGDVTSPPNTSNPVSVTMNQARSITANYGVQWQLTLAITAGVPNGLTNIIGGTTATYYDDGTVLSLTATASVADGTGKQWGFKNWTGDVTSPPNTSNPVSVTMSAARSVTANYVVQWKLTLAITAGVPSGLTNISGGTNGTFYDDGTVLTLTATTPVADGAGKQWAFKNWTGDVASPPNTTNPVSVTMSAARSVTANYVVQWQLTLAITAGVPNGLSNISGGTNGTFYDDGTVLTLTATTPVAEGTTKQWVFKNWTGDVPSPPNTTNPVSVTMSAVRSVTANYGVQWKLTLAITAGVPTGLSNLSGGTNGTFYDDGAVLSLSATTPVADGVGKQWAFKNWTGDVSGSPNSSNPVSVTMNQARSLTANYVVQWQLTLAITAGVPGGLTHVTGGTTGTFYDDGAVLSLTAGGPVADGAGKQWAFKNWTGDVAGPPNPANPVSVTMSAARSITANYGVQWQLTLAITAGVPGGLTHVTGGTTGTFYDDGAVLSLTAGGPVADGAGKQWAFKNWTGDVASPPNPANPVSVTMSAARSVTANYGVQWLLTLATTAGVPGGAASNISGGTSGTFYDDGTLLNLTATTPVADGTTKQWVFQNWTGDVTGSPTGSNPVGVTMSQARSIMANYQAQYKLTLAITAGVPSALGNISGGSNGTFYPDGTVLSLGATTPVADGATKQWVFQNWTGDVTSPPNSSNPVSVTMNQARSIMANYQAQYKLTLAITVGVPSGLSNISGGTSGTFYPDGTVLSLGATTPVADGPGKQWGFKNWSGDVSGSPNAANPVSVTMNQARSITANYVVQWQLTLAITSGVPGGLTNISGGSSGSFYDDGTVLSLGTTAAVADGAGKQWGFKNWTGDVAGSPNAANPVSVTMNQVRSITANYVVQWQLTLAVTAGVPGTTANISGGTTGAFYDTGTVLTLTATTPVADGVGKQWAFKNWTGDVASPPNSANPVMVTMSAPRSVTANYGVQWLLTLATTAGVPGGAASNISGGTTGTFYDTGAVLTLTATTPVADGTTKQWVFQNWTGDVTSPPNSSNPVIVTMNQARSIMANYQAQYKLTLAITAGVPSALGNISGGSNGTFYPDGSVLTLGATTPVADGATKQWVFQNWTGDVAGPPNSGNPVMVTMNQARSIMANYQAQYKLTLAITVGVPSGLSNISGGTNGTFYPDGTVLSLGATTPVADGPGKQWGFKNWSGDVSGSPNASNPVSVTMDQARSITANYVVQWQLTLAITAGVPGGLTNITGGTSGFYDTGTVLNLGGTTPVADGIGKRWVFTNWTGDVTSPPNMSNPVSVTMNQARSIGANYKVQYLLTITTVPAAVGRTNVSPTADGWYDTGTNVPITATTPVIVVSTSYTFDHWSGDASGSVNPTSVTMTAPRNVTANYNTWTLAWNVGSVFSAQYSDPTGLKVDLSFNGGPIAAIGIHFSVGTDASSPDPTTNALGVATDTTKLTQAPGSSYTATAVCGACGGLTITNPYTVTKEDARTFYTGPLFASTSSSTSTTATVLLTATIQDITAVPADLAYDANPGDIRKAVARFVNRDASDAFLCSAPIGLVTPGDLKTGTLSCSTTLTSGTGGSTQYTIGIIVDDYNAQKSYYIRNASTDDQVVTVSQLVPGMITGGGYLQMYTPTKSVGQYPGDAGLKTNFGFNVKNNKTGKNLQGNLNFIIRSGGKVYQIKANAMDSLGISQGTSAGCNTALATPCQATFTSKANLTDITNETNPISLGGNLNMIVTMTDKGEPGSSDTFAITLYDGSNNLLFSSNWNGTATVEQLLGGGNTVVH